MGGPAFYISYTHIPSKIKVSAVLLSFAKCFFMLHFHAWNDNKNSLADIDLQRSSRGNDDVQLYTRKGGIPADIFFIY